MNVEAVSSYSCAGTEPEVANLSTVNGVLKPESSGESLLQKHLLNGQVSKKFSPKTIPQILNEYSPSFKDDCMDQDSDCCERSECSFPIHFESAPELESSTGLSVKCLQSLESLKKTCEKSGLKFNDCCDVELTRKYKLKRFSVKCLQPYEDLRKKCEKLNLKLNSRLTYQELYEVDLILDHKIEEGEKYYLVKWKNYDMNSCTWEPRCHLTIGSSNLVSYYDYLHNPKRSLEANMMYSFITQLITRTPCDILTLRRLCSLVFNMPAWFFKSFTVVDLKKKAKSILNLPIASLSKVKHMLLNLMHFAESRKFVLIDLQEWKNKINSTNPSVPIEVENDVDLEKAPTDFQFIHDYVSNGIDIPKEPVAFCKCDNCYECKNSCCPHNSDGHFAYNKFGRLQLLPGYPIYECNDMCKCGPDCANRVVQNGQKLKVGIFRTSNGCGWGLKALENISKDQFVLEYLGEILTSEDAEARGNLYDYIGRSYLFDLDYGVMNCQYTIDARHLGNSAHFINHSCNPNLHVFAVWINNQDPLLPRLAFFAKRKINRGEELTFDYKMIKNSEDRYDPPSSSCNSENDQERFRVLCKCNSKNCRKFLI